MDSSPRISSRGSSKAKAGIHFDITVTETTSENRSEDSRRRKTDPGPGVTRGASKVSATCDSEPGSGRRGAQIRVATEGTGQQRRVSSVATTRFSASGTAANFEFKEAERAFAKERRGEGPQSHRVSLYDEVDFVADAVVAKAQIPWWMAACSNVSRIKKDAAAEEYARNDDKVEDTLKFGFQNFDDAGYCLVPNSDTHWPDKVVVNRLQLQMAIHRKTCIERLCLRRPKAKLAPGVSKEQIVAVAESLKKLEHVNILRVTDVLEDDKNLFFLYENFPAVTLLSAMEHHNWTETQVVNLVREVSAATSFALSLGVHHLGWTLAHILLPATCWKEDPSVAKVFGFGLMGLFTDVDGSDLLCWSPEAIKGYSRYNEGFVSRLEKKQLRECDAWSLGVIVYSAVARRPPFIGDRESVCRSVMQGDWSFGFAFDEVDVEAKEFVESLMQRLPSKRIKINQVFFSPWIRRRWKPQGHSNHAFQKLAEFCAAPLPKRLFGRFLVKFLDANHLRQISKAFYALDVQGDGVIDEKDLKLTAKDLNRSHKELHQITSWMLQDGREGFSLHHFAETMAEEVIDGKALRHSFESLDDDGSGQITPQELYDTLVHFSRDLTMGQVLEHIVEAEGRGKGGEIDGEGVKDHKLDFEEYVQLFPVRLRRLKHMEDRMADTQKYASEMSEIFEDIRPTLKSWIKQLDSSTRNVRNLTAETVEKKGPETVKQLSEQCQKISELLKHPPGPAGHESHMDLWKQVVKTKKKAEGKRKSRGAVGTTGAAEVFGYDSFIQDRAIQGSWPDLIEEDRKILKTCIHRDLQTNDCVVDYFRARDAGQNVVKQLEKVLEWCRGQMQEYDSFVDVFNKPECSMPELVYSNRGLPNHGDEDNHSDQMAEYGNYGPSDAKTNGFFSSVVGRWTGKSWLDRGRKVEA